MIGYKAFDHNLCCRGFQYEVGKTYTKDTRPEEMKLCTYKVFHFCRELHEIENNSEYILEKSRICEIIAGDYIKENGKYGTNKITILREIVGEEKDELLRGYLNVGKLNKGRRNIGSFNLGDRNGGNHNSGDYNTGWGNVGSSNSGDCNIGFGNSGDWNKGSYNTGSINTGDRNTGTRNFGNYNVGSWNMGDRRIGYLNTKPVVRMFNKEVSTSEPFNFPDFFYFNTVVFVSASDATERELEKYAEEIETCNGFLRKIPYEEAWRKSWDKAPIEDKRKVLKLPNWDNEIFKEISGIDVEKELGIY